MNGYFLPCNRGYPVALFYTFITHCWSMSSFIFTDVWNPRKRQKYSLASPGLSPKLSTFPIKKLKSISPTVSLCASKSYYKSSGCTAGSCLLRVMCLSKEAVKQCSLLILLCIHITQHGGRDMQPQAAWIYLITDDIISQQWFHQLLAYLLQNTLSLWDIPADYFLKIFSLSSLSLSVSVSL